MFRASRQMVHGQIKLHVQRMLDRLHDTQRLNNTVNYERKNGYFTERTYAKPWRVILDLSLLAACIYTFSFYIFTNNNYNNNNYIVYVKIHINITT